jgi:hypothetical protein
VPQLMRNEWLLRAVWAMAQTVMMPNQLFWRRSLSSYIFTTWRQRCLKQYKWRIISVSVTADTNKKTLIQSTNCYCLLFFSNGHYFTENIYLWIYKLYEAKNNFNPNSIPTLNKHRLRNGWFALFCECLREFETVFEKSRIWLQGPHRIDSWKKTGRKSGTPSL